MLNCKTSINVASENFVKSLLAEGPPGRLKCESMKGEGPIAAPIYDLKCGALKYDTIEQVAGRANEIVGKCTVSDLNSEH